jgi:hypothetical protein
MGLVLVLAACSGPAPEIGTAAAATVLPATAAFGTQLPFPTPEPATSIPTLAGGLPPTELKYRLLEEFPDFFFCDPDYYPIAREDEGVLALQRFPELQADPEEFQTILRHIGLTGMTIFTDEQKLLIYREHKKLAALVLELAGTAYRFQLQTQTPNASEGFVISGSIDGQGNIKIQERQPAIPSCPICLAAHALIDTPRGPVAVEDLQIGDPVWTVDSTGRRVAGSILMVARRVVPAGHLVVRLVLEDGRQLQASPGHPSADGRRIGDLRPGDLLDGARIVSVDLLVDSGSATYDLLPSGDTGFYWADGILVGSTLTNQ